MSSISFSDPFALDEQFQDVHDRLHRASATARWSVLQAVAALPSPGTVGAEPYLLELAGPLGEQVRRIDPVGVHPDRLAQAAARLRQWKQACADLQDTADWVSAVRGLEAGAAQLYAYAGDPAQAARVLSDQHQDHGLVPVFDIPQGATPGEILEAFLEAVELPDPTRAPLRTALHALRADEPGVRVPIVERPAQGTALDGTGGLLRFRVMQVQEHGAASSLQPIRIRGLDFGRDRVETVEEALHTFLASTLRDRQQTRGALEVDMACDPVGLRVAGTSFQMGVGGLAATRIVAHRAPRVRIRMTSGVGVTGGVTREGDAAPVAPGTLAAKVCASFFSPLQTLAVPAGQEDHAAAALAPLREQFPHGRLHVVGVRSLSDILDRRRLTRRTEVGRVQHVAERAKNRTGTVALVAFAAVLLAALVYVLVPPVDQVPVHGRFSGAILTLENRHGQVIEQVEVGASIANAVRARQRAKPVAFPRLGRDSTPGVVYAFADADGREVIRARTIEADTLLWEQPVESDVVFPQKPFTTPSRYHVEHVYAADTHGDERPELYALFNHNPYFPALLVELDRETGNVLQRYVHPGHLTARIRHADLDGDGTAELVTGGYNNAFKSPVVVVLSADDFEGRAPATPAYRPAGAAPASHHEYLRLPATPVQEAAPKTFRMVRSTHIFDRHIRVSVEDGTRDDGLQSDNELFVRFDADLQPISVGTSSQHDRLAEDLVAAGQLDAAPGPQTLQVYKDEIRYWNGEGWQSEPARSARPR